jgi:hypothetical protein
MRSPFEQLLGDDFERLPAPVRRLHSLREPLRTAGRADITAARGPVAWLLCWMAGLPRPGHDVEVSVLFEPRPTGDEHWDRKFGDRRYVSTIAIGTGRDDGYLIEHFGPFDLRFQLTVLTEGLAWSVVGWRLLRVPLPRWSVPRIKCLEAGDGARFTFDIDVAFPVIGWLMHYRGWLLPQDGVIERAPARSA